MIPKKNDEVYLSPSFKEIIQKATKNRDLRKKFFEKFNFEFKEEEIKIATGHQPYIFHAGIWAKIIFLNFFKEFKKIFITHDADVKRGIFLDIPIFKKGWHKLREYIYLNSENKTFEEYEADKFREGIKWFSERFKEIERDVLENIREKVKKFCGFLEENGNPVESLINARRSFEKIKNYKELRVSQISKEDNFLRLFLYFLDNGEEILEIYNKTLKEFREVKGIKKTGEPFPFLLKEDEFVEIPFWILKNGRKRVFKKKNFLYAEKEKICGLKDFETLKNLKIRPRAFTLSIYQRVFLSDFFIHGYGGKLYDEFTEEVFEKIFKLKMPECGILTGTFYIFPGNPEDLNTKLSLLKERKNFIIHHPEKFLKDKLSKRKEMLLKELENAKDKRKIISEIKEINERLKDKVKKILEDIDKKISKIEEKIEEQRVKYFREYPYFYIDFERIERAIKRAK